MDDYARRPVQRNGATILALALASVLLILSALAVILSSGGLDLIRSAIRRQPDPTTVSVAATQPTPVAASAAENPPVSSIRLWSNGDSTSFFVSVELAAALAARGATMTQPEAEYQNGSGLITREYFDWPSYLRSEMAEKQPNLVVFMIGANDAKFFGEPESYRVLVAEAMDLMQSPERRLVWVGQPNSSQEKLAANLPAINAIFKEEAAKRPWVTYVDLWAASSDADGNYTQTLTDASGATVVGRANDGVHLTQAGGRILADAIMVAILDLYAE